MSKKIYSFLLGGAVAIAAFAATEFVGNGTVGRDMYNATDYKVASVTAEANVDGQTVTFSGEFGAIYDFRAGEWAQVVDPSADLTGATMTVTIYKAGGEVFATGTGTPAGGFSFSQSDVEAGDYTCYATARFAAYPETSENTVTSADFTFHVDEPAPFVPAQLYLSWANWSNGNSVATPLEKIEEGVYQARINPSEFTTNGNSKIQYMCLTENPKNWSVVYKATKQQNETVTVGSTTDIAETPTSGQPGTAYVWDLSQITSLSYDLVITANLNTHKLSVVKYEPPYPTELMIYPGNYNANTYFEGHAEKLKGNGIDGILKGSVNVDELVDGYYGADKPATIADNFYQITFVKTYGYSGVYYGPVAAYDNAVITPNQTYYVDLYNGYNDNKGWNLRGLGKVEITLDLKEMKVTFGKEKEMPATLSLVLNGDTGAMVSATEADKTTGVYTFTNVAFPDYQNQGASTFYLYASDTEKYGAANNASITKEGLEDGGVTAYNENEWTIVKGKYDISVDLKNETINVTYVGGPETVTLTIDDETKTLNNDGYGVYTTTYSKLTKDAVDFTVAVEENVNVAGKVTGDYGLYNITYTYGGSVAVDLVRAYTVKFTIDAPTFYYNNEDIDVTAVLPEQGTLYDGEEPLTTVDLTEGGQGALYVDNAPIMETLMTFVPGAKIEHTYGSSYGASATFYVEFNKDGDFISSPEATANVPAQLTVNPTATPDATTEEVVVSWNAMDIEGVTYHVYLVPVQSTYAVANGTEVATTTETSARIAFDEFALGQEYNIVIEATWGTETNGGISTGDAPIQFTLTGIDAIAVDGDAVYFDVNGRQVVNPANGLYIRVANGKAQKVMIRK